MANHNKDDWLKVLSPMLSGINCYNPNNIDMLEPYVRFQADNPNEYDFDANLVLMKLYQFYPNRFNFDVSCMILIKSIMTLPNAHLPLLLSVLPLNQQNNEEIKKISLLCTHLESCCFTEFWVSMMCYVIIGGSLSEPHTSHFNGHFVYICIYVYRYDLTINPLFNFSRIYIPDILLFKITRYRNS
jgi:hypothetical protein